MKFQQRVPDWDDLIDFAVSDTWLDHYHALGMTWRHSRPPPDANQEHITRLLDKNAALEAEIAHLRRRIGRMAMERARPPLEPPPRTEPKPVIEGIELPPP